MANKHVEISSEAIRKALNKYRPEQAITEFIWNGFDAKATRVEINYKERDNSLGLIESICIEDNREGIIHEELDLKFKKFNESQICGYNYICRLLFKCSKRQDMPGNGRSKKSHKHLSPPPLINHCYNTITYGNPYKQHRYYLGAQRYGAIFAEVSDIFTQPGMIEQPLV